MKYFAQIVGILLAICGTAVAPWTYETQDTWPQQYPFCGQHAQSPIAIDTQKAVPKEMPPLQFFNYDTPFDALLLNNCHTAEITLPPGSSGDLPEISGGHLHHSDRYRFFNAHFHWRAEHVINSTRHTMELHIVHMNTKYSHDEAGNHKDGYAVVAIYYSHGLLHYFSGLQNVNWALPLVRKCGTSAELKNFVMSSLIGGVESLTNQQFYTYQGSFTTPPCTQAVEFVIFPESIDIGALQYGLFRELLNAAGTKIETNSRHLQHQGHRVVYVGP